jgi:hypothetical protein
MRADNARIGSGGSASATFSATDSASNTLKCWKTMPTPRARASAGLAMRTGSPFQKNAPELGCSTP